MAQKLCDGGHYASSSIRMQASRLEREWKNLAAALDDRSAVLNMSTSFHKKAEQVKDIQCINDHTLRSDIFLPKCPTHSREMSDKFESTLCKVRLFGRTSWAWSDVGVDI